MASSVFIATIFNKTLLSVYSYKIKQFFKINFPLINHLPFIGEALKIIAPPPPPPLQCTFLSLI